MTAMPSANLFIPVNFVCIRLIHALLLNIAIAVEAFAADISRPTAHTKNILIRFWESVVVRRSNIADVSMRH